MTPPPVEVRVSRILMFLMMAASALFIWLGLDFLFLHRVIDESWTIQDISLGVEIGAAIFFFLVPALILWKLTPYMIHPPVMLRVDSEGVSFGTGFGYVPYRIPLEYLDSVERVTMEGSFSMPFALGLALHLKKSEEIASSKLTSAGISYSFYRLFLRWSYMNQLPGKVAKGVQKWIDHSSI